MFHPPILPSSPPFHVTIKSRRVQAVQVERVLTKVISPASLWAQVVRKSNAWIQNWDSRLGMDLEILNTTTMMMMMMMLLLLMMIMPDIEHIWTINKPQQRRKKWKVYFTTNTSWVPWYFHHFNPTTHDPTYVMHGRLGLGAGSQNSQSRGNCRRSRLLDTTPSLAVVLQEIRLPKQTCRYTLSSYQITVPGVESILNFVTSSLLHAAKYDIVRYTIN